MLKKRFVSRRGDGTFKKYKLRKKWKFWREFKRFVLRKKNYNFWFKLRKWKFNHKRILWKQFLHQFDIKKKKSIFKYYLKYLFGVRFLHLLKQFDMRFDVCLLRFFFAKNIIRARHLINKQRFLVSGVVRKQNYIIKSAEVIQRVLWRFKRKMLKRLQALFEAETSSFDKVVKKKKKLRLRLKRAKFKFRFKFKSKRYAQIKRRRKKLRSRRVFFWKRATRNINFVEIRPRIQQAVVLRYPLKGEQHVKWFKFWRAETTLRKLYFMY